MPKNLSDRGYIAIGGVGLLVLYLATRSSAEPDPAPPDEDPEAPTAIIDYQQTEGGVLLDAADSQPGDHAGAIVAVEWEITGPGGFSKSRTGTPVNVQLDATGTYTVDLIVENSAGLADTTTVDFEWVQPAPDGHYEPTTQSNELRLETNEHSVAMHYHIISVGEIGRGDDLMDHDDVWEDEDGFFHAEGQFGPAGTDTYHVYATGVEFFGVYHLDTVGDPWDYTDVPVPVNWFDTYWEGSSAHPDDFAYETEFADPEDPDPVVGIQHSQYAGDIGGGPGYPMAVERSDADHVVSSWSELESVSVTAQSGDVIWVEGGSTLRWDGQSDGIRFMQDDLTLASARHQGNPGVVVLENWDAPGITWETGCLVFEGQGVRVTGLELDGGVPVGAPPNKEPNNPRPQGLTFRGVDPEIDNCHLHNWSAAVNIAVPNSRAIVHHCTFEDNAQEGLGYGIHMSQQETTSRENQEQVLYNVSDNDRHFVSGSMSWVTIADNDFLSTYISHAAEVRSLEPEVGEPSGNAVVRNNEMHDPEKRLMVIRGTPTDGVWVEDNYAANPSEPCANRDYWGDPDECVVMQPFGRYSPAFDNVFLDNNQWGGTPP